MRIHESELRVDMSCARRVSRTVALLWAHSTGSLALQEVCLNSGSRFGCRLRMFVF